eukprot:scaffold33340_cov66-Cyclotella_meneghiniana.AAC.3
MMTLFLPTQGAHNAKVDVCKGGRAFYQIPGHELEKGRQLAALPLLVMSCHNQGNAVRGFWAWPSPTTHTHNESLGWSSCCGYILMVSVLTDLEPS